MKDFIKLWLPVIGYGIVIFWVSSLPQPFGIEIEQGNIDKVLHFCEYAVLGFLLMRPLCGPNTPLTRKGAFIVALLIGVVYGITDELHQSIVPGRDASICDVIFDAVGTLAGIILFDRIRKNT